MSNLTDPIDPKEASEAKLCAYLEGELAPNEQAEIEQHLAANPQHRQLLLDLARTREWMRAIPMETSPMDLAEIVQGKNERSMLLDEPNDGGSSWKTRWPQMAMLAAMVLLVAGLGVLLVEILRGPRSDSSKTFSLAPVAGLSASTAPVVSSGKPTDELNRLEVDKTADQPAGAVAPTPALPAVASAAVNGGKVELKMPAAADAMAAAPGAASAAAPGTAGGEVRALHAMSDSDTAAAELKAKLLEAGYHLPADQRSVGFVVTADSPSATAEQLQGFFSRHQLAFDSPSMPETALAQLNAPAVPTATTQPALMNSPAMNNFALARAQNTQNDQLQQTKSLAPIFANKSLPPAQATSVPATMPAEPVIYVAHGLTPLQLELLSASLETDNPNQTVRRITLSDPVITPPQTAQLPQPTGTFNKGQTLSITVQQLVGPGIDKTNVVKVADDGTIALPMVDPIPAAGASAAELQQRIAQKYKEANLIPQAAVTIADVAPTNQPIESGGISTTLPTTQPASQPAATEPVTPVPAPAPSGPAPAPAPTGPVPAPAPVSPGVCVVVLVEKSSPPVPGNLMENSPLNPPANSPGKQ